ncbi:hypothetical protein PENSTE_c003G06006 [Penicillium steckii]|uniref:F-box domain-containing protein n=1 Tax=Penicillium steckii TaxID=303698 RepID=A0A1V6TPS4_9EURO|nr:hypothetical protein PENSTE_c003G06006 [Penicillium steckii]
MATMPSLTTHNEGFRTHLPGIYDLQVGKYSNIRTRRSKSAHSIKTAKTITTNIHQVDLPVKVVNRSSNANIANSPSPSAANTTPPEILIQIFSLLTPRDFDNARRTCSQWMRVGMNRELLEKMLKRAGWWDAHQQDAEIQRGRSSILNEESEAWRMSRRFATECLLAGRKTNIEGPGFLTTQVIDFSAISQTLPPTKTRRALLDSREKISQSSTSTFSTSICGNFVLVTSGCRVHVFQLLKKRSKVSECSNTVDSDIVPIATIECIFEVISAVIDTTGSRVIIAALLKSRTGMVCDLDVSTLGSESRHTRQMPKKSYSSPHYYYNVCSEDHPPRTIALYPGRRCVAFGCAGGIEIHWVDQKTQHDQRKHFPMSQPSEVLHFLPSLSESPTEMRLISSLAGPGVHECACRQSPYPDHSKKCQFHLVADARSSGRRSPTNTSALSLVRATHCHHYRAVPINDGFHMIFVDPRTGFLCIGSDAPIGGPTSLTRAFVCTPPFLEDMGNESNEAPMPTVFAVGSDLKWGLRVVAAYQDRIVLYSVPLDVFNVIRKERELQGDGVMGDSDLARDWFIDPERCRKRRESLVQNQNGEWEFLLSVRCRPTAMMWPFKIYGKEIGKVENVVELALQSDNGGARVWAFGANGKSTVLDIDTFKSPSQETTSYPKCKFVTVGSDGSLQSTQLSEIHEPKAPRLQASRKRKLAQLDEHSEFVGRYGANRLVPNMALKEYPLPSASPAAQTENSPLRRPSFAACIVDFKIPELGTRKGRWRDDLDIP